MDYGSLNLFFEKVKSLGLLQRIFSWGQVKRLSYDAFGEYRQLAGNIRELNETIEEKKVQLTGIEKENAVLRDQLQSVKEQNARLDIKIGSLEEQKNEQSRILAELNKRVTQFEQTDISRKEEYEKNVAKLNAVREGLEQDRQKLSDDRVRERELHFERMKQTWSEHEQMVESAIRNISRNYLIDYIKDVPFKGKPDNTLRIADEYVIFDAKSPASDDLGNFPNYIKAQTESLSKYINQEGVRKDIFLVVPSNTVQVLKQFSYNMGDYNVYVVTIDSLEPIILSLKRIEDYEFAEQLTPEERENICRIIGKFAHTSKRRVQVDIYFALQWFDILNKAGYELPVDMHKMVEEFEKAEKLNPPQEKRAKSISSEELFRETEQLFLQSKAKDRE